MKKIIFIFLILLLYKISISQIDFVRATSFNAERCIGVGFDMILSEDSTLLVNHSGSSLPCSTNNRYSKMARLKFNNGTIVPDFRASPFFFTNAGSTDRLYEYNEFIYSFRTYYFSRFTLSGDVDLDWPKYDNINNVYTSGIKYIPEIDRFLLVGFFIKMENEGQNAPGREFSCLWIDHDGNRDTSFSAPIFHYSPDIQDSSQHFNSIGRWTYSEQSNYAYVLTAPTYANGHYSGSIFRIFPNGEVDTSFQFAEVGQLVENNGIAQVFEQNDRKIIVTGSFLVRESEKVIFTSMIRLNHDGSFDPTFNYKNNTLSEDFDPERDTALLRQHRVEYVTHWKDDLYIISGRFINYQGQYRGKIAVIDKDGFLIDDYFQGTGFTESDGGDRIRVAYINKVIVTSPDTILVCGRYIAYNDEPYVGGVMKLVLESPTSTPETSEPLNIKAYPNPTTGIVTLESDRYTGVSTGTTHHPKVTITDQLGRVLKQDIWPSGERFDIDISHLSEGVYFIRLHEGSQVVWTDRLVKVSGR